MVNLTAAELFSLRGRVAVLSGASGFLGRTMARTLAANGARVIALGRGGDRLDALTASLQNEFGGDSARACAVDMYDAARLTAALDDIAATERSIDIIVNNAHELSQATGFNAPGDPIESATAEQWSRNLSGGVLWAAETVRRLGPSMKAAGRGSIINVSTMYAAVAPSPRLYEGTTFMNPPGYSASKAALVAYTRYVASFWGIHGIRCNAILPGPISNTEDQGPNAVHDDGFKTRLRERTALNRLGQPVDLAGALLLLASDASSFMTGHALVVDGGWTTT